jgi:hypothetical protein
VSSFPAYIRSAEPLGRRKKRENGVLQRKEGQAGGDVEAILLMGQDERDMEGGGGARRGMNLSARGRRQRGDRSNGEIKNLWRKDREKGEGGWPEDSMLLLEDRRGRRGNSIEENGAGKPHSPVAPATLASIAIHREPFHHSGGRSSELPLIPQLPKLARILLDGFRYQVPTTGIAKGMIDAA